MAKLLSPQKRAKVKPYRLARALAGLTRRDVAQRIGITERTLYNWERGKAPRKPKMDAWADALGMPR